MMSNLMQQQNHSQCGIGMDANSFGTPGGPAETGPQTSINNSLDGQKVPDNQIKESDKIHAQAVNALKQGLGEMYTQNGKNQ